ncbi:MAG: multicopper oxidase domain-containing protein, partial [Gammaproteobacteria bacterium]|nr:multicopper oxidase domain-containing protein [Gammaproteobacteria bacterium]
IGHGHLNPQIQLLADGGSNCDVGGVAGCQTRTETAAWSAADPDNIVAPPLLEGYNGFLGTTDVFEWGKQAYPPGENGGITGVVYYTTTRAESDPRFAAAETWEPGIPRVALALYFADANGVTYHKNADGARGAITTAASPLALSDVDNYPLGWQDGTAPMGPEDVDHDGSGSFDLGDALEAVHSDSWDDSIPTGCPDNQSPGFFPDPFYQGGKCYDGLRNYSQVRPAVFDGGYAFGKPFTPLVLQPGYYVVQANPPRGFLGVGADGADANGYGDVYQIQQEEDKNVDFGDTMAVSPQALPPLCMGGPDTTGTPWHVVPDQLTLFPGVDTDPRYAGNRPGCDFRQAFVADGKNTAADFFMFTETPVTGHIQGFVLNDLANEFDPRSPNFGEKMAPSWIPVSVRDYAGNEVYHTYTDRWGTYNAIVPTAYRINTPMPSGVSPNMLQVCLNAPTMQNALGEWKPEPFHNRQYTQFCYTLDFKPGQTTYLDTPVLPIAAFVGPNNWQLDCDYISGTPVINFATVGSAGPYISAGGPRSLTIHALGNVQVPDPRAPRVDSPNPTSPDNNLTMVTRDFGFGGTAGQVWIGNQLVPAANVSWSSGELTVDVPVTISGQSVRSGQLKIVRSNGLETVHGLTLTIDQAGQPATTVRNVSPGQSIQTAIDAASAGDMVMVAPGTYPEMLVITKPIRLQGWGASSVIINPVQSPTEKIAQWRQKLNTLANCTQQIGLLPGQPNNTPSATAPCGFTPGSGLFLNEEGAGILVAPRQGVFGRAPARIDGVQVTGADQAAGILVNGYAAGLEISNNILANNQGPYAAGIRVGQPLLLDANGEPVDAANANIRIHHNHVAENGGLFEAGAGIGLYTGSNNYQVTRNHVCGNYAAGNGAGIAHWGLSPNGVIADNKVLFNQSFDQTVGTGGNGGGIYVAGVAPAAGGATPGSGNVRIERNLVLGNNAGSANGGGIALQFITSGGTNGGTIVSVTNNMVTNNVAGLGGGGVSLDNARRVEINNNTIVNNDSTATAALAFGGCTAALPSVRSCPQTAGVWADATSSVSAFRNNIVLGNRAFHWQVSAGIGALVPDGFADLGGTALYPAGGGNNPAGIRNSLLGDSNALLGAGLPVYCGAGNGSAPRGNTCRDATPPSSGPGYEGTAFAAPYWNSPPVFAVDVNGVPIPGTSIPPEGTTLANLQAAPMVAAATDEGGNFIDVHYGPLSLVQAETLDASGVVTAETISSYHLVSPNADTINASACTGTNCSGNAAAPGNDIDGEPRPKSAANPADRGADEYYATRQAAAQAAPVLEAIPPQTVLASRAGLPNTFSYQPVASDANGDQLQFRVLGGLLGTTALPAGISFDPSTGIVTWNPVVTWTANPFTAPAICTTTGGNSRTCALTVQVTDQAVFPSIASCLLGTSSCASRILLLTLVRSQGSPAAVNNAGTTGPLANQALQVNTTGIYTLPAPGVLANDANPNAGGGGTPGFPLMARLVTDGTVANGRLTLGADGSVQFIPNADWVGTTSFTYQVSNDGINWYGSTASPAGASVELRREIAVTSARYINGAWTFSGLGTTDGRRIQIVRDRAGPGAGNANITTNASRPTVSGGHWPVSGDFTRSGGPTFIDGDTVTITAQNPNGGAPFQLLAVPVLSGAAFDVHNTAYVQCPGDRNSDAVIDAPDPAHPRAVCRHLAAGDGFAVMGDGTELYTFGFNDVTGTPANQAIDKGILNAHFPAPTLQFKEGDEVYLTLTNVGMLKRPDLFDPHSVHFHGFPNAGSVFDGVPESSVAISMGFSFTYYYRTMDPGTYMYHCHVEAAEHMQMGMLGNLFVTPAQDGTAKTDASNGKTYRAFVYNDGDGSTGYDVMKAIQLGGFDGEFHKEHLGVQPLPFANMRDDYPMLNGRGYPDTVQYPDDNDPLSGVPVAAGGDKATSGVVSAGESSQQHDSIVTATAGQRILLRISNLNVTQFFTLGTTGGLRMKVVGTGAHILRGPDGSKPLYYSTTSVTLGGGESADVLIDTSGVQPGTYLLYSTNLNELSNGPQDFGGMLTTIVIK